MANKSRVSATGSPENAPVQEAPYLRCRAGGCRRHGLLRAGLAASDCSYRATDVPKLSVGADREG